VVCATAIGTSDKPMLITVAASQLTLPGALIGDLGTRRQVAAASTQSAERLRLLNVVGNQTFADLDAQPSEGRSDTAQAS
jgi:hypothetical protein